MHKKVYNNEVIKFDLTNDGNKFVCKNNIYYTISNVSEFTRTCQYIRDENDKNNLLIEFYFLIIYNGRSYKRSICIYFRNCL